MSKCEVAAYLYIFFTLRQLEGIIFMSNQKLLKDAKCQTEICRRLVNKNTFKHDKTSVRLLYYITSETNVFHNKLSGQS